MFWKRMLPTAQVLCKSRRNLQGKPSATWAKVSQAWAFPLQALLFAKKALLVMAAARFSRKAQERWSSAVFSTSCIFQEGWMLSSFCMAVNTHTRAGISSSPWVPLSLVSTTSLARNSCWLKSLTNGNAGFAWVSLQSSLTFKCSESQGVPLQWK